MAQQTEIKINLGAEQVTAAESTFGLKPAAAQRMTVWFGEYLNGRGGPMSLPVLAVDVILRLRHKHGDPDDSTVKLRVADTTSLPADLPAPAKSDAWTFKIEGDWAGTKRSLSASAVTELEDDLPDDLTDERFSPWVVAKQAAFLRQITPLPVDLGEISVLGPIRALKWDKDATAGIGEGVVAERWDVGGLTFLELSMRVPTDEAEATQAKFEALVSGRGFDPSGVQETKTRLVLTELTTRAAADH